jgi:hypothetical protein
LNGVHQSARSTHRYFAAHARHGTPYAAFNITLEVTYAL